METTPPTPERIRQRIDQHAAAVARMDETHVAAIAAAAEMVGACLAAGGAVYLCGNGGSAADAQHIACELVGRFLRERRALPAAAFSTDTSILTAVGNDYTYDGVFARQAEAFVGDGDVLWALSTSGNSANVVAAAEVARRKGGKVLGFVGGDGGQLAGMCDVCFCAPAGGSFAVQQLHQVAYHAICELVEAAFADEGERTD